MYRNMLHIFRGCQSNDIHKKLQKSGQKGDFGHQTENISVQISYKFIIELKKFNISLFHKDKILGPMGL
jgi:hypothetical protein